MLPGDFGYQLLRKMAHMAVLRAGKYQPRGYHRLVEGPQGAY